MLTKATSDGIAWASKSDYEYEGKTYEADLKDGDKVTILNSGTIEPNQNGGEDHVFKLKTRNGEKKMRFNQSSINVLVPVLGEDSEDWVGKEVNVLTKKGVFAGKKGIAAYFVTEGWYLDDFGDLVNDIQVDKPEAILTPKTANQKEVDAIRNIESTEPNFDTEQPND